MSSELDSTLQINSSSTLDLEHARPNKRQCMDPTLVDSPEPLADFQRSWGFQQMVNEQTFNRQYQILRSLRKEKDDLMQTNASCRNEVGILRQKNDESEGRNNLLSQQTQDLYNRLQGTLRSNQRLQERSDWLSGENQRLIEASSRSLDAHFREIQQKNAELSEYKKCVRTQRDQLSRMETSAKNHTWAYHSVQGQLETLEVEHRVLEDQSQATKSKYNMRLKKLGGYVLAEQDAVRRTLDKLQEFEEAVNMEVAKSDASEYSLVLPVCSSALG